MCVARLYNLHRADLTISMPVIEQLYERAHEYANLANRAKPVVSDVLTASDDYNLEAAEIYRLSRKSRKRRRGALTCRLVCMHSTHTLLLHAINRWPELDHAASSSSASTIARVVELG